LESIGTLAGGIAHDFNNILSAVLGYTELALEEVDKGTRLAKDFREVYRAGIRARDLVKQILAFARKREEELRPTKVNTIAKEALKPLRSTIPTSIELKQNIESDSLIMADPSQAHQIIMNLCTNASHAMEEEGGVLGDQFKTGMVCTAWSRIASYRPVHPVISSKAGRRWAGSQD